MWDLAAEAGLYRLRGHRDAVTDVLFVERGNRLISASKDSHVRVWELATQHCAQTLVGHRCEVWALDCDAAERRLVTGAADASLRVFVLRDDDDGALPADVDGALLAPMGALPRPGTDRVTALRFAPGGDVLAVAPAGRLLELWAVHAPDEARRRARRRRKRKRDKADAKASKKGAHASAVEAAGDADDSGAAGATAGDETADKPVATDEFSLLVTLPLKAKVLALAFAPAAAKAAAPRRSNAPQPLASLALSLANNCLEAYDLLPEGGGDDGTSAALVRSGDVASAGHRADVRALALAPDDSLLLSTSHAGAKVRDARTSLLPRARTRMKRGARLFCRRAPPTMRSGGLWTCHSDDGMR